MRVTGTTKVIGIFGYPVEHSFSPAMHNTAFAQAGLNYVYVPFPVEPKNLPAAVNGIRGMGLHGVNVTIPHKNAVVSLLDELSPEAEMIGAVNTIVNHNGVLKGYNTDAPGFARSLEQEAGVTPKGQSFLIMGAGGAARAVSVQLALSGAREIILSSPVESEVVALKKLITEQTKTVVKDVLWHSREISQCLSTVDVLINATPLGMFPKEEEMPPVDLNALLENALVCDLIYNPGQTKLLKMAHELGHPTLNGLGMLLYQGVIAFKLWTGAEPPVDIMRASLLQSLKS